MDGFNTTIFTFYYSTLTPSPSPPNSPSYALIATKGGKRKSTPPKHQTIVSQSNNSSQQYSYQQQFTPPIVMNNIDQNSMPKSRSQESQWNNGVNHDTSRTSISSTNSVSDPSNEMNTLDKINYSVATSTSINNATVNLSTIQQNFR